MSGADFGGCYMKGLAVAAWAGISTSKYLSTSISTANFVLRSAR